MKMNELELEYPGVFGTITQYTRNPYVVGYLETLKKYLDKNDSDNIKLCLSKILDWYTMNMEDILTNQYVMNKKDHVLTKEILENAFNHL